MKRLLLLLGLLPFATFAQTQKDCTMDMYGCYVYALNAFAKGSDGLAKMRKQVLPAKATDVYIAKQYYTVNLPEKHENITYHFENIGEQATELYTLQQSKKATCIYMTDLSIASDTCRLWLIPIHLTQKGKDIEIEYPGKGCKLNFSVHPTSGKLCYANTVCPPANKED